MGSSTEQAAESHGAMESSSTTVTAITAPTAIAGPLYTERSIGRSAWGRVRLQSPIFDSIEFEIVTDMRLPDLDYSGFSLEVRAYVKHRDTAERVPIMSRTPLRWDEFNCPEPYRCAEFVRKALIHLATHEIDEMLLVDGIRYRDPHR